MNSESLLESTEEFRKGAGRWGLWVSLVRVERRNEAKKFLEEAQNRARAVLVTFPCEVDARAAHFERYFRSNGFESPLSEQIQRVRAGGFPSLPTFVSAMFAAEMSTGVLLGAQDFEKMVPPIIADIARPGDSYLGHSGVIFCRAGELVIRDADGIVASVFHGSDQKTRISRATQSAMFFAFGAPGVSGVDVAAAMNSAVSSLGPTAVLQSEWNFIEENV